MKVEEMARHFEYSNTFEIVKLVHKLQENLQYPNSENSLDELHYLRRFEGALIRIMGKI